MHEVAIAEGVSRIVLDRAAGRKVRRVGMVIGHLRQVVPGALTFGFELVTAGTEAEGAEIEIERVPAAGICRACGEETEQSGFPLRCGDCGGLDVRIVRGEELRVEWIDLETNGAGRGPMPDDEDITALETTRRRR